MARVHHDVLVLREAPTHSRGQLRGGQREEHPGVLRDGCANLAGHDGRLARAGRAQAYDRPVLLPAHVPRGFQLLLPLCPRGTQSEGQVLRDLPLENALQSVEPQSVLSAFARCLLAGGDHWVRRRAGIVCQVELARPELLDQGALARDERLRVLDVVLRVGLLLHLLADPVGGVPEVVQVGGGALPVRAELQSPCLAAQARRHARGHLRDVQVRELAERDVQHNPLAEELVVVPPDGVHGHELLPAHGVVVRELLLRHVLLLPGSLSPKLLQPACDGALVRGLAQELEEAHVVAAPLALHVRLQLSCVLGAIGSHQVSEAAALRAHAPLAEVRRLQLQDHLGLERMVLLQHTPRDGVGRGLVVHPFVVTGVAEFGDVLRHVLQE
eukprot:4225523-Pyramimonas_sp.AAC.2